MRLGDTIARWGPVTRILHWTMAALILFQLGLGVTMIGTADLALRFALTQTHKSWGTVIFALALVRVGWRLLNPARPPFPPGMPRWQVRLARASHRLLYLLMILMPVSGWVVASASPVQDLLGIENRAFGLLPLPDPWVPGSAPVEAVARIVHAGAAVALGLVLVVHAGAAIKHELVDRDRTLARMIRGA